MAEAEAAPRRVPARSSELVFCSDASSPSGGANAPRSPSREAHSASSLCLAKTAVRTPWRGPLSPPTATKKNVGTTHARACASAIGPTPKAAATRTSRRRPRSLHASVMMPTEPTTRARAPRRPGGEAGGGARRRRDPERGGARRGCPDRRRRRRGRGSGREARGVERRARGPDAARGDAPRSGEAARCARGRAARCSTRGRARERASRRDDGTPRDIRDDEPRAARVRAPEGRPTARASRGAPCARLPGASPKTRDAAGGPRAPSDAPRARL